MSVDVDGHEVEPLSTTKSSLSFASMWRRTAPTPPGEIESLEDEMSMMETKADDWYMDQEAIDAELAEAKAIAHTRMEIAVHDA